MPAKGRYWMRADFTDGWVLAEVDFWAGRDMYASLCGCAEPYWPHELEGAEWREISPPLD